MFGFLLIDNTIEVRSLVVSVLDCLAIGDLHTIHLQLEVVPARKSVKIRYFHLQSDQLLPACMGLGGMSHVIFLEEGSLEIKY